ncbi:serine hydrolase [Hymenobacter gummosus]|uniref:Serine hydrolase n=1 Tax=Hymenobacter gummosus TaxID=1776032 RepID=A0A3S0K1K6_9BACT|nr:serine hydrolase domain-containing protein [Hymenobacter gummosus]RTQ45726.1 serine hydrolase [Hymenobacter gummosus]
MLHASLPGLVAGLALALAPFSTPPASAPSPAAAPAALASSPARQVEALLRREMQERRIPGLQVAVVQRGRLVLLRAYGLADVQQQVPVTDQSVFAINSCTKALTGVAIMQLVEAGRLELDAPVSRYLGGLPAAWQPVTVRQLLTHVSGLPNVLRVLNPATGGLMGSEAEAWAKVRALPLDFAPGTQFSYNQTNYALLGRLIDTLAARPFAEVFREQQFQVAGMAATAFGDSRDVIPRFAPTYRYLTRWDGQALPEPRLAGNYAEFPAFRRTASGLNSTAADLARWLIALQSGQLLKTKAALQTLWTPGRYLDGTPTQWALGWLTKPRPRHPAVLATGGGRAAFAVYPDDELAVVVLTNLAGSFPEDFLDELAGCYQPAIPAADPVTWLRMQLRRRGFEQAEAVVREEQQRNPAFRPAEPDLNDWAYRLLSNGQLAQALPVFRLTVSLYPQSWNAYDSYGEALAKSGQKAEAIRMYQQSVALNPNNQGGRKMLEQLSR